MNGPPSAQHVATNATCSPIPRIARPHTYTHGIQIVAPTPPIAPARGRGPLFVFGSVVDTRGTNLPVRGLAHVSNFRSRCRPPACPSDNVVQTRVSYRPFTRMTLRQWHHATRRKRSTKKTYTQKHLNLSTTQAFNLSTSQTLNLSPSNLSTSQHLNSETPQPLNLSTDLPTSQPLNSSTNLSTPQPISLSTSSTPLDLSTNASTPQPLNFSTKHSTSQLSTSQPLNPSPPTPQPSNQTLNPSTRQPLNQPNP